MIYVRKTFIKPILNDLKNSKDINIELSPIWHGNPTGKMAIYVLF